MVIATRRALAIGLSLICGSLSFTAWAGGGHGPHDFTGLVTSRADFPRPGFRASLVMLDVPHAQQETNLCVPTSAAMVLQFFGDSWSPRQIKALSRGTRYVTGQNFNDFTFTWYADVIRGLETVGYHWRQQIYPNNQAGFTSAIADLVTELRKGFPILIDVALFGSHTFAVAGIDTAQEMVYIVDPNLPPPGLRKLRFDQLEPLWNGKSYGTNGRPVLFVRPRSAIISMGRNQGGRI